jgi:hypothetical protein
MYNGKIHNLYPSPDIIRQIKCGRMSGRGMWHALERGETCRGFWWEIRRKSSLGTPRRRWENEIKMDLREIGWGGVEWIRLS